MLLSPGLAHHRDQHHLVRQHRVGRGELEFDGRVVDLLDRADALELERALRRRGHGALQREHRIVGGEGRAVVEHHTRPQLEAPGRRVERLPRHGERAFELELLVVVDQRLVDLRDDARLVQQRQRMRINRLRIEAAGDAQRRGTRAEAHGECKDAEQSFEHQMISK